ncbi:MAG: hydrogenase 4 subunit B, partial [Coriobacteriales bacterium]|nr:hydrogenase 4 subunit B [Coriobacteriales bacterium]
MSNMAPMMANLVVVFSFSLLASVIGSLLSIILKKSDNAARITGTLFGIVAAILGTAAGLMMIFEPGLGVVQFFSPLFLVSFSLQFSPLAGLLVTVISLLALTSWIYSFSYVKEYKGKVGSINFFMNLFIPAMLLVITADNAFWFIVFFEVMSLTSYFLVIVDQDKNALKAGLQYLIMSHCGLVLVMIAFFIMGNMAGSLDFADFRNLQLEPALASVVFLLAFVGFGFKAGLVPFHSWLPLAHPSAPSHVSALMSGGMIKIGIFGIIKVSFDLLGACGGEVWWGIVVLIVGAVSSVIGVAYALVEHDIKRLLAYHSCENVGIIALGLGAGMIGWAADLPLLAGFGLMAGLYHLLNHAIFKALLFLGAGSVMFRTHTKNMELMGGLSKLMPITAACFLIGSLAISAIPPLNGFVSEWYTYQSLFNAALSGDVLVILVAVLAAVALALTGALAVMCFVKAYGVTFSGLSRSDQAKKAKEAPATMLIGMIVLAAACVALGIGAAAVAPVMQQIAASTLAIPTLQVVSDTTLVGSAPGALVSTPMIAIMLIGLIILIAVLKKVFARGAIVQRKEPWAAGYQPDVTMPVIASSFAKNVQNSFAPLYKIRVAVVAFANAFVGLIDRKPEVLLKDAVSGKDKEQEAVLAQVTSSASSTHGAHDEHDLPAVTDALERLVQLFGRITKSIEGGNYQVYCL